MKMIKGIITLVILLVLLAGGVYLIAQSQSKGSSSIGTGNAVGGGNNGGGNNANSEGRTFAITGSNFKFSMNGADSPDLAVNQGDTVKIVFTNNDGFHDWRVDEFNAFTPKIGAGKTETVEFVANKKGTFEYYCSVGEHRAMGMRGNLIVQ